MLSYHGMHPGFGAIQEYIVYMDAPIRHATFFVPNVDDWARVWVNGSLAWDSQGCCGGCRNDRSNCAGVTFVCCANLEVDLAPWCVVGNNSIKLQINNGSYADVQSTTPGDPSGNTGGQVTIALDYNW